jgi:heme/copper-type cytochrome/quinol oxidase subunit 3
MLTTLAVLGILFVIACIFEWEWLATTVGVGLGCVLIYALFFYFTEFMIFLWVVVGFIALAVAGPPVAKGAAAVIDKVKGK